MDSSELLYLSEVLRTSENNDSGSKKNNENSRRIPREYHNDKRTHFHKGLHKTWSSGRFIDCLVSTSTFGEQDLLNFPCHRVVLSSSSPRFSEMIEEAEAASDSSDVLTLQVDNVLPAVLHKMLHFMYTSSVSLTDDLVVDVFITAHHFGMKGLQSLCEEHVSTHISTDSVLHLLLDAESHNAEVLKAKCLEFVRSNAKELFLNHEEKLLMLTKQSFQDILELDFRMDEHTVFNVARRWAERNAHEDKVDLKESFSGIVEKIRLVSLRKDFLQHQVLPLGIVPEWILMDVLFYKAKDPAYLEFQQPDGPEQNSLVKNDEVDKSEKLWLQPRGPIWKTMEDFTSEQEYGDYLKSVLRPGMMMRSVRSYESVQEGDIGEFVQWNTGIPPCQVRWQGYGSTYWLYFRDLVIVEE